MKKLCMPKCRFSWVFGCIVLFSLFVSTTYALPVGNPLEPCLYDCNFDCDDDKVVYSLFSYTVGFYGDYVFNRHMETVNNKNIDTTRLFTNAAYLGVNLCECIEVFTVLGVSRLSLNTSLGAFNPIDPHPLFEIESSSAFSYSVGARATLFEYRCAALGIEGQYFSTHPNIKRMYIAAGAVVYPDDDLRTRYCEWQVGGALSYCYNEFFIPYVGVKYARSYWRLDNGNIFLIESNTFTHLFNLRNRRNWGYAVGLSLCPPVCEKIAVTAEARFGAEKALYINGQIQF